MDRFNVFKVTSNSLVKLRDNCIKTPYLTLWLGVQLLTLTRAKTAFKPNEGDNY